MRKLIDYKQVNIIECDNCIYKIPFTEGDQYTISQYINQPCPRCGANLLTQKDCKMYNQIIKAIDWVNKWLGWLAYLNPKSKSRKLNAKVKDGVTLSDY